MARRDGILGRLFQGAGPAPTSGRASEDQKPANDGTVTYDWRADPDIRRALSDLARDPGVGATLDGCARYPATSTNAWRDEMKRLLTASPKSVAALRNLATREQPLSAAPSSVEVGFFQGVIWALTLIGADESVPLLTRIADQNGRPHLDRPHLSIAVTAVRALGRIGGELTGAPLRRLKAEAPLNDVRRAASRELDQLPRHSGGQTEVPDGPASTFELNAYGERRMLLEDGFAATVRVTPDGKVRVEYSQPNGDVLDGIPADEGLDQSLRALNHFITDVRAVVTTEKARLRTLLGDQRSLAADEWVAKYLDHPITGTLSRSLVWEVSTAGGESWEPGLPVRDLARDPFSDEGAWRLTTADGTPRAIRPHDRVRLLRPLRTTSQESRAWRKRLDRMGLHQAISQLDQD